MQRNIKYSLAEHSRLLIGVRKVPLMALMLREQAPQAAKCHQQQVTSDVAKPMDQFKQSEQRCSMREGHERQRSIAITGATCDARLVPSGLKGARASR